MSHGLTGAVSGASARAASTASTASMTLPDNISPATYPITGTSQINAITASPQNGRVALLEFASTGCRVVMGGNLAINGDYLSTAGGVLALVANGSTWEEITRTQTVIQPYNAAPNGNFTGWQRPFSTGSTYTAPANNTQTADRWYMNRSGAAVLDVVRDTSVPAVAYNMPGAQYSAKINVTTADASLAAGDLYAFYTLLEGYDVQPLANGLAASWWVKAHRPGTYTFTLINKAFNRNYMVEYVITAADTWQYFTAVAPAPTGVWPYDNQFSMYCIFSLAMGSSFGSGVTTNVWETTGNYTRSGQINGVAATSDTFSVWGLNIVPGTVPQPFNPMPFPVQMARLYRYYEAWQASIYDYGYHLASSYNIKGRPFRVAKGGTPAIVLNATNQLGVGTIGLQYAGPDDFSWIVSWASSGNYGFTLQPTAEWNPA